MTTYARIANGAVVELFEPPAGVSIADCFHSALVWVDVTSVSPAPQQGWTATEADGAWTFAAPVVPTPTPPQQAQALISAGIAVTCSGDGALSGTYPCDAATLQRLGWLAQYCSTNGRLPGGLSALPIVDIVGTPHAFDTPARVVALASACADFVTLCDMVIIGQGSVLPSAEATIA